MPLLRAIRFIQQGLKRCLGGRGKVYYVHQTDSLPREMKLKLGEQWRDLLGFARCDCWTKWGPDNTCERCAGYGYYYNRERDDV